MRHEGPERPDATIAALPAVNDLLGGQVDFICDQTKKVGTYAD